MRRWTLAFPVLFGAVSALACSSPSSDGGSGGDTSTGGQGGSTATGGSSGTSTTGGSAGTSTTGGGGTGATAGSASGGTGQTGGTDTGGTSGTAGSGGFTKTGICGQRSEATVSTTDYQGYEEFYMVSEEVVADGRLDEFNCLVRFDVTRSAEAPAGCVDLEGVPCLWTHEVTYRNPTIITDIDGACAKNELHWNPAWMADLDGSPADYGYIDMYQSHDSVVMKFSGTAGAETWDVFGRASWDDMTGAFSFDNRIGACRY